MIEQRGNSGDGCCCGNSHCHRPCVGCVCVSVCACVLHGVCVRVCVGGFLFSFYQTLLQTLDVDTWGTFQMGAQRPTKHHKIIENSIVSKECFESEIIIFPQTRVHIQLLVFC